LDNNNDNPNNKNNHHHRSSQQSLSEADSAERSAGANSVRQARIAPDRPRIRSH
jgi:hypothetical protein